MQKIIETAIAAIFTGALLASIIFIIMRTDFSGEDIKIQADNTYYFRINENIVVEGFKNKEDAMERAKEIIKILTDERRNKRRA